VDVRLHKTGEDCTVASIDYFISGIADLRCDLSDAAVTNQHIAANDRIPFIHRHDGTVSDEN
jgi:hypothetical protein